jgi:hypothetical protein
VGKREGKSSFKRPERRSYIFFLVRVEFREGILKNQDQAKGG